jgi:hypothetical protein
LKLPFLRAFLPSLAANSFVWFAIFIALGEYLAFSISPLEQVSTAAEMIRNPLGRIRIGWPEYLDADTPPSKKLVVIVTNSQGYAKEYPSDEIYPYLLKARLEEFRPDLHVENWAVPGLRAIEADLLAILAAEREAALVLFLVNRALIDTPDHLNLDYPDSDVSLVAGDPRLWPDVLNSSVDRSSIADVLLLKSAMLYSNFIRGREILHRRLEMMRPHPWGMFLYRDYGKRRIERAEKRNRRRGCTDCPASDRRDSRRILGLDRLARSIGRRFERNKVNSLWVWQPKPKVARAMRRAERRVARARDGAAHGSSLVKAANQILTERGLGPLDMRADIPIEDFRKNSTHFTPSGHRAMADLLFPILVRELQ